jgi:hypothetical protein
LALSKINSESFSTVYVLMFEADKSIEIAGAGFDL